MAKISLSVVKNEADVIESMIRHNSAFVDHMHIVDNNSADRTKEIVRSLVSEGLPIQLSTNDLVGHRQRHILNELINNHHPNEDIILLDADEFLRVTPEGAKMDGNPVTALFSSDRVYGIPMVTYLPSAHDDTDALDPVKRLQWRRKSEPKPEFKVAVPAWLKRPVDLGPGSHMILHQEMYKCRGLEIAHLPIRSLDQLISKILIGSFNLRLRSYGKLEATHWRDMAQHILENGIPKKQDFIPLANRIGMHTPADLIHDPLPVPTHTLKYTSKDDTSALHNLMHFTADIVAKLEGKL